MLLGLAIRDIVLIDRLGLRLGPGLSVLTGETGAGKSILLDALGLALGVRADSALIRHGAHEGSVSAEFDVPGEHPARRLLRGHGLESEDAIVLRRVLDGQGRSRAYLNDQPVSANLLRAVAETLVEIHASGDHGGLLNAAGHRALLDAFGGIESRAGAVGEAWAAMRRAAEAAQAAEARLASARSEQEHLHHLLAELDALRPEAGEEGDLAEERTVLMHAEKLAEAVAAAAAALSEAGGVAGRLRSAERALERVAGHAPSRFEKALAALARASAESADAEAEVEDLRRGLDFDPSRLEQIEQRLFALRALARKHGCQVDGLSSLRAELRDKLGALEDGAGKVERLRRAAAEARAVYVAAAAELGAARRQAAERLDSELAAELGPLKLDKARFETHVEALDEAEWSEHGAERVTFQVTTNPGAPPGPLARIASAGELSRFLLALKVVLARARSAPTLIFDEVDRGVGGATAHAVGERLARLSEGAQVVVVTHSPQVAARADHHWRISKRRRGGAVTRAEKLDAKGRREEVARMLAGAEVTAEARAAAERLIEGQTR